MAKLIFIPNDILNSSWLFCALSSFHHLTIIAIISHSHTIFHNPFDRAIAPWICQQHGSVTFIEALAK